MKKKSKKPLIFLVIGLTLLFTSLAIKNIRNTVTPERISYLEYEELLKNGQIDTVVYDSESEYMTVFLFNDETKNLSEEEREAYKYDISQQRLVLFPDNTDFRKELLEQGVIVRNAGGNLNTFSMYFNILFPIILFASMFFFMAKASPMSGGGIARKIIPSEIDVTFDDVIGHEEIKGDLQLLVKQLKNGVKAKDLSHGVLFEGSAGTGKTMLAKAIAHEAGVNFISVNSSNFIEMYVGLGARRVRSVFKQARENSPCVLFFDELDAVGAKRGSQASHKENDQTINALLTELDGFEDKGDILVIAATNRADNLDDALLRSGRFDRKIKIEAPKKWETRKQLFDHYLEESSRTQNVNTEILAKQTMGFSGADIASVCREAKLIAFREDSEKVSQEFLEEAIDKMIFKGNRSNEEEHQRDLEYVAYHESGHAVMSLLSDRPISRISIMGMTSGVGGAVFNTDTDTYFETKAETEARLMMIYAGRASEEIKFGKDKVTQGASNDITQATQLLFNYTAKCGYDTSFGLVDAEVLSQSMIINNTELVNRISELSKEVYAKTVRALSENYSLVEKLAKKMLEVKTLSGEEVESLLKEELALRSQAQIA